jgi:AraC-like DNA-binding protein/mannose-6-phosphate isomerase-like protein (cupin superfamily)
MRGGSPPAFRPKHSLRPPFERRNTTSLRVWGVIPQTRHRATMSVNTPSPEVHPILQALHETILSRPHSGFRNIVAQDEVPSTTGSPFLFLGGLHMHDYYEWVWLLENRMHLDIDGTVYELAPGDFCLIPPRTLHAEALATDNGSYKALWGHYADDALFSRLLHYTPIGHIHSLAHQAVQAPPDVDVLLAVLDSEQRNPQPYAEAIRRGMLSAFAHVLARALEASPPTEKPTELPSSIERRVVQHLNQHFAEDITLNDIARAVGMSRNNLCAAYKRETGKTVGETLIEIRLQTAKRLLLDENLLIHEIAKATGFGSATTFCRAFQRHEQIPPSRYARSTQITQKNNSTNT